MLTREEQITDRLEQIIALPKGWHMAGSLNWKVLQAIVRHSAGMTLEHTLETGAGKSTLLFSHISRNHKVFAMEEGNDSLTNVKASPLLNKSTVEFIFGSTQQTLPRYKFEHTLQIALLDGPHAYPFPDLEYYFVYPLLEPGALLIVDDIRIPSVYNMFKFIEVDEMFSLIEVIKKTAFFRRTQAKVFNPYGDGWDLQSYNQKRIDLNNGLLRQMKRVLREYKVRITS